METFLVIPTIRNLDFLDTWKGELRECHLLIVEDHADKQINAPKNIYKSVHHVSWQDIQYDFGKDEWIFSRKNAGIRSYGFWKAYQLGADIIITLDDDCYPAEKGFIKRHTDNLSLRAPDGWVNTYPHPDFVYTRGIPYLVRGKRRVVISHGLWTDKIDLDGITETKHPNLHLPAYPPICQFIPKGAFFPMCSMNLAFTREATPLMYFPLMGSDPTGKPWGYDRFDDIWAGIFAKKILDHLGLAVVNGSPFVDHRKVSDPHKNIIKEKRGMAMNEQLWVAVDKVQLTSGSPKACYRELAEKIVFPKTLYFKALRLAMITWSDLF